ncbi:5'-3' exonuclease H3TH domain-containing protein [Marinomonas algicola]|uniref:5'-3' exonuclease H3TH domain-containing protein n=1 Tax=Marinomonas algicola TaxID=2773454 RepID=UPI00174B438A|nr:5'-3' exonuclease H3TH domain-containing protein [Marinomonas algicola]
MQKKILLVDGLNLIRRIYAALESELDTIRRIERTQSTSIDTLTRLTKQFLPSHAIVVFDASGKTWRHTIFPEYKLGRVPMDDALLDALPEFAKLFRFNGIVSMRLTGWEADDIIATLAVKAAQNNIKSYIVSTDKGFSQLLGNSNILQYDCFAKVGYDKVWAEEKFGLPCDELTDYWALVGDTTNRIPGVMGVGPKTALIIMQKNNTIEKIYNDLTGLSEKQQKMLHGHYEQCLLSRQLVTLKTDIDVGVRLSQLTYPRN